MAHQQRPNEGLRELALFAGAGGGILGGKLLGWRTVCAVEINAFCARRLMQRQNEGYLPPFPIWDDVCTFDGRPWKGIVDVVSGGFPCQDISTAGGPNRRGIEGEKSGLWKEMARIISEIRSPFIFVENSPALTFRGQGIILGNLAEMGYDARWGVFSAGDVGARHKRERIWILGINRDTNQNAEMPIKPFYGEKGSKSIRDMQKREWPATSRMVRNVDDLANFMDRHAAIGNGQVPAVVRLAWNALSGK
jgi:DNA (cytosine-5)-methyltransferase 1